MGPREVGETQESCSARVSEPTGLKRDESAVVTARTYQKKVELLAERFFPSLEADLSDIQETGDREPPNR